MKFCSLIASVALLFSVFTTSRAEETQAPVRTGSGQMTFDTVPGWGLRPDGSSALGPTHGAVVIDKAGNIYTSAGRGVFAFSPDGSPNHWCAVIEDVIHNVRLQQEAYEQKDQGLQQQAYVMGMQAF